MPSVGKIAKPGSVSVGIKKASSGKNIQSLFQSAIKNTVLANKGISVSVVTGAALSTPTTGIANTIAVNSWIDRANQVKEAMDNMITAEDYRGIAEAYQVEMDFTEMLAEVEASTAQIEQTIQEMFEMGRTDLMGWDDMVAGCIISFGMGILATYARNKWNEEPVDTDGDGDPDVTDPDDDNDNVSDENDKHPKTQGDSKSEDKRNGCVPPIVWDILVKEMQTTYSEYFNIKELTNLKYQIGVVLYEVNNSVQSFSVQMNNKTIYTLRFKY